MSEHLIWRLRNNDTAKHLCGLAADEIERLRAALAMARVDLECLSDYAGCSEGAKAVAKSAHLDVCSALRPLTDGTERSTTKGQDPQ